LGHLEASAAENVPPEKANSGESSGYRVQVRSGG